MAPLMEATLNLTSTTPVSPLCYLLPTLVTLLHLCNSNNSKSTPLPPSALSLVAAQSALGSAELDDATTEDASMAWASTDRGPPTPCDTQDAKASWNCADMGVNATFHEHEWFQLNRTEYELQPRNETTEERDWRLQQEKMHQLALIKACVLIAVVVIILLTCFKVVFQLYVTYSNDSPDKNDR